MFLAFRFACILALSTCPLLATSGHSVHLLDAPCRVLDTRIVNPGSPHPAFSLLPVYVRAIHDPASFQGGVAGCSVPDAAVGVVVNLTVVSPLSSGHAMLIPGDAVAPPVSSVINFQTGNNHANGVTMRLAVLDEDMLAELVLFPTAAAYWLVDLQAWIGP